MRSGSKRTALRRALRALLNQTVTHHSGLQEPTDQLQHSCIAGLEDLRNLINTLISTVDETFVKEMREKAKELFFEKGDQDTLYFKERILPRIEGEFPVQLREIPPGAEFTERGTTFVKAPRFYPKGRPADALAYTD
jgi:hypothetical protein